MDRRRDFFIQFEGLKETVHHFDFEVDDSFFSAFEGSLIEQGRLQVSLELDKKSTMMELLFHISGNVTRECDLCGDPLAVPIDSKEKLIVKYGEEGDEAGDELAFVAPSAYEFDVAPYIYEFIVLAMPVKNVHPEGECNPEAIELLKKLNEKREEDDIDPRWSKLKQFKKDN